MNIRFLCSHDSSQRCTCLVSLGDVETNRTDLNNCHITQGARAATPLATIALIFGDDNAVNYST
jgi:hypothetical protein